MDSGIFRQRHLSRLVAAATLAFGLGACSSVPGWVNPGTWFGGDGAPSASADNGQTPDLASLPDRPAAPATPDQNQKVADSLAAAQAQAQYSSDALRGGTEPAAPPPADTGPNPQQASASDANVPPSTEAATDEDGDNTPAPAPAPPPKPVSVPAPTGPAMPGTLPAPSGARYSQAVSAPVAAPAPSRAPETQMTATQVASLPAPVSQPAAAPSEAAPVAAASADRISPSDAALGFKPSTAPPLDPTISRFVPPSIVAHYEQTAANAGIGTVAPARQGRGQGMGGPEKMGGAVVANLETLQSPAGTAPLSAYDNPQGQSPAAVIFFPGDSVYLNDKTRIQVRAVVERYKAAGSHGFIRVVGHSSSRTPDMSVARHLEVIFQKSQERAKAVAAEIIREGVPADKVLVDAVGDSEPVYYESMPKGEDGNRRAEIFLQG